MSAPAAVGLMARRGLLGCGLLLGVVLLYLPGLDGPLLLDDHAALDELVAAITGGYFSPAHLWSHSGPLGRPLAMASFALDAAWHGQAWSGWKATNLVLHLACGITLFGLARVLARSVAHPAADELAFVLAALWLVHPLHVSTVLYTVQRMTQLAGLVSLLALYAYARGRVALAAGQRGRAAILAALFGGTVLAALAKETGLLVPWLILALEFTVFGALARPRWLRLCLLATTVLPLLVGIAYLLTRPTGFVARAYAARAFGPGERLLTEARVLFDYLRWIVLPRADALGFHYDDYRVSRGLLGDGAAQAAVLGGSALVAMLAWARRRAPLVAAGGGLFLCGLALESSVLPLDLVFEHRTYLPAAGVLLAIASAICAVRRRRVRYLLASAAVGVLASACLLRVLVWGDAAQLHHANLAARPDSVRARVSLVEWYLGEGHWAQALALLEGRTGPTYVVQRQRLLCLRDGRLEGDPAAFAAGLEQGVHLGRFAQQNLLALVGFELDGRCALGADVAARVLDVLRRQPIDRHVRYRVEVSAAHLAQRAGRSADAQAHLQRAAQAVPADAYVHYLAAEWWLDAGQPARARAALATARASRDAPAFRQLDVVVERLIEEAVQASSP